MSLEQLTPLEAINQLLEGTQFVAFNVATDKRERYRWVQKSLVKHRYLLLGKVDKGIVTRCLMGGDGVLPEPRTAPGNAGGRGGHHLSEAGPP